MRLGPGDVGGDVRFVWNSKVADQMLETMNHRLDVAANTFLKKLRQAVNRPNPTGLDPSAPGEYPKKHTGAFRQSLKVRKGEKRASKGGHSWERRVGTFNITPNHKYFWELQYGRPGAFAMKPRPWATLAYIEFASDALDILLGKGVDEAPVEGLYSLPGWEIL